MAGADAHSAALRPLADRVVAAMARLHVPGVAVGLLHEGEEHAAGFGVTSVEHPLPVDAGTLFQIGSITKTATGTLIMRLVEQGRLELDTPIRSYLPDLRLADEQVAAGLTLRHLLTHTGGWAGDYFDDPGPGDDALATIVSRLAELPQLTPLGEVWSYNNAGFYIAGRLIEVVAGKTYEAAARELLLHPLGMDMSFFFAADAITHRVVVGHQVRDGRPELTRPWALARAANPVGGIISTAQDLLRYARFHLGDGTAPDGTRLLRPESVAAMQTPLVPTDGVGGMVGLSWMLRDADGVRIVRHGGATKGQMASLVLVPAHSFAIAVLTNANRGDELHREVTQWALAHYLGITEPAPVPSERPELAPYVGRYAGALSTSDVELSVHDGKLVMHVVPKGGFPTPEVPPPPAPPPVRLAFCGDDCVLVLDPPMKDTTGEFLRNPDRSIAWFRYGGRIRARQE